MFGFSPSTFIRRRLSWLTGLSRKLIVFTALLLIVTCSTFGWYFLYVQVENMNTELLRSGTLLATNLGTSMRYSVIVGDRSHLEQLLEGVLTNEQVAYAVVRSKDGRVLTSSGKAEWDEVFQKGDAAVLPEETRLSLMDQGHFDRPYIQLVQLLGGKPIVASENFPWVRSFATFFPLSGELFFYHFVVPITGRTFPVAEQRTLDLMFGEPHALSKSDSALSNSVYGLLELGLSTAQAQAILRRVMVQVLAMTCVIFAGGLMGVIFIARRMTTPLKALQTMAAQVASGQLDVMLAPSSSDEIGDLTRHFNFMATAIREHEHTLQGMNRSLEARVQARTQELEQANFQLKDLDRLKTSLLSTASHELRTPLTSITINVENLLDGVKGALTGDQRDILRRQQANVQRLRRMIDDLLNVAQLESGHSPLQAQAVGLQQVMEGAWNDSHHFATAKQVVLINQVPHVFPPVFGDPDKLGQIFTNLIHNAVKFNAPGGRVLVTAREIEPDRVVVCVEDSGCGISPGEIESIFLPFYRSPAVKMTTQGSGLGLAIVKHLVELHHGSITVESSPGQGARFLVTLPRISSS